MDDLPTDFDVVVVGTGMTESIVAAAASRIGKSVLHLDTSDFYGGLWASFNFDGLQKIIDEVKEKKNNNLGIFNLEDQWYIKEKFVTHSIPEIIETSDGDDFQTAPTIDAEEISDERSVAEEQEVVKIIEISPPIDVTLNCWTQEKMKKEYRKFNVDLAPKLLYARGELVELLISSNIARYAEFRCVNRVLTWIGNTLEPVPCSRADVFATKHVTVVEKRMLMKLLSSFMDYDKTKDNNEFQGFENKTFLEYLKSKKLTGNLIHYVLYAIAGSTDSTSCFEGIERSKRFLTSLGRYGNTPFLWSMYGCGELPQCFCRLCAVFGGVYCLKRPLDSITVDDNVEGSEKPVKIFSNGKTIQCNHVVLGIDKAPKEFLTKPSFTKGISRAVFVINKSILKFEKESLTLLRFPPLEGKSDPVTVIELGPSTSSCPNGLFLLHMTCSQKGTAKEDLFEYAEKLLNFELCDFAKSPDKNNEDTSKPQVLWSFYFNMADTSEKGTCQTTSPKVHLCVGPDTDLDFDHAVKQGREIFSEICVGEDFLPRAPDPEEIIFETEAGPEFEKNENACEGDSVEPVKKPDTVLEDPKSGVELENTEASPGE